MPYRAGIWFACMALLLLGWLVAAPLAAQERPTVVGVVDIQKIMREATAARSIQEQIERRRSSYQAEIKQEETRLREVEQELARQQSLLAPDAFAARQREFRDQVAATQRTVQERRRILDQAYAQGVRQIQIEVTAIIRDIAQERRIDIVVPVAQTLFAAEALRITDEALKRLNKSLPEVTLEFKEN